MYDGAKTVKPLLPEEATEVEFLLWRENPSGPKTVNKWPEHDMSSHKPIALDLTEDPENPGKLRDEKILEAWFMENFTDNGDNTAVYRRLKEIFGPVHFFANCYPAAYIQFMDILTFAQEAHRKLNFNVIELKIQDLTLRDIGELAKALAYANWVSRIMAEGDTRRVNVTLVARDFADELCDLAKTWNEIRARVREVTRIELITYGIGSGGSLELSRKWGLTPG